MLVNINFNDRSPICYDRKHQQADFLADWSKRESAAENGDVDESDVSEDEPLLAADTRGIDADSDVQSLVQEPDVLPPR